MNNPLKLGGILFLLTAISVGILGTVNLITKPIIERNEQISQEKAMKILIKEAEDFEDIKDVKDETIKKVVRAKKGSETVGYIVRLEPNGYGGPIKLLVGMDTEGIVKGISILEHAETPGFGANADKDGFKNQFKERTTPLKVSKSNSSEGEIEAITGATITSTAITEAVNTAVQYVINHQVEWGEIHESIN